MQVVAVLQETSSRATASAFDGVSGGRTAHCFPFHSSARAAPSPVRLSPTARQAVAEAHETRSSTAPEPASRPGLARSAHEVPLPLTTRGSMKPVLLFSASPTATQVARVGQEMPSRLLLKVFAGSGGVSALHPLPFHCSISARCVFGVPA